MFGGAGLSFVLGFGWRLVITSGHQVSSKTYELHELHDQQAIEEGVRQPVPCETTLHTLNAEWNTNVGHGLRVVFRQKLESRAKRGKTFRRPPEV